MRDSWHIAGAFVASAPLCAVLIVLLRPLMARYAMAKLTDRSSHRVPTPQGGGIAVVIAALAVAWATLAGTHEPWLVPLTLATLFIAGVGAVDDIRTIPVVPRLLMQAAAVAVVVAALPVELRVLPVLPWQVERVLLILALLWFVNLTNFMDGIDWMTAAEVVPVTGGLILLGVAGALPTNELILALTLCGAMLGFAPFNRPVAKLFLGDVGSLPIGLLLGTLLVLLAGRGQLAAALILPLYYLADATITLVRRVARGEPFWNAHRSHFYQQATDRGLSVLEIVARVFAVNSLLVGVAITTVLMPTLPVRLGALAAAAVLVGGLLWTLRRGRR